MPLYYLSTGGKCSFTEFRIKSSPLQEIGPKSKEGKKGEMRREKYFYTPTFFNGNIDTPAIEDHGLVYIDHRNVDTVTLVLLPWYPDPWEQEQGMIHDQFHLQMEEQKMS